MLDRNCVIWKVVFSGNQDLTFARAIS